MEKARDLAEGQLRQLSAILTQNGFQYEEATELISRAAAKLYGHTPYDRAPAAKETPAKKAGSPFGSHRSLAETLKRRKMDYALRACIEGGLRALTHRQAQVILELARKFERAQRLRGEKEWIGTYDQLAADAGVSRATAIRAIRIAIDHKWISRRWRGFTGEGANTKTRPSAFYGLPALRHLMGSYAIGGSNLSHPDSDSYNRKTYQTKNSKRGRESKGDRPRRNTLPRVAGRSIESTTAKANASSSLSSPRPCKPRFARERANVAAIQTTPGQLHNLPPWELAAMGLRLVADRDIGAIEGRDQVLATATEICTAEFGAIAPHDWDRASHNVPVKAVLALIATIHKTRTHTKNPIRLPDRYFQSMLRPDADPGLSVVRILESRLAPPPDDKAAA